MYPYNLLDKNYKEQYCGVSKVCFLNVNNLTANIINTKYMIFMHTYCVKGKLVLICITFSIFCKRFFCYLVITGCFDFNFGFYCLG